MFYHKIKCRKKEECSNRKCKFWLYCENNRAEREKVEIEYRRQALIRNLGLTEEDFDEEIFLKSHRNRQGEQRYFVVMEWDIWYNLNVVEREKSKLMKGDILYEYGY